MKKVAILQSSYIPWKGYFDIINSVDEFILYDDAQYTKRDWRNRNRIVTHTGLQWLTIPVLNGNKQKIKDTFILDQQWRKKHWCSIYQAYKKSSFFDLYANSIEEFYIGNISNKLSDINCEIIKIICRHLGIQTTISWSMDYELVAGKTERLLKLVQDAGGTEYISGPAAKSYLDETLFTQTGIKVTWMNYDHYPPYHQLGTNPFEHGVSILDLLFNEGPRAPHFMKSFGSEFWAAC